MTQEDKSIKEKEERYQVELRTGVWIFFLLIIFTAGEFIAALIGANFGLAADHCCLTQSIFCGD